MSLPSPRILDRVRGLCGEVTCLKCEPQFKPFVYLNCPGARPARIVAKEKPRLSARLFRSDSPELAIGLLLLTGLRLPALLLLSGLRLSATLLARLLVGVLRLLARILIGIAHSGVSFVECSRG
jgi:hypothetical protein